MKKKIGFSIYPIENKIMPGQGTFVQKETCGCGCGIILLCLDVACKN